MRDAQKYLNGLVAKSPAKLKVLEAVYSLRESFTIRDVANYLREQGFRYAEPNISSTLRGLRVRGLLTQFEDRPRIRRGAFTIHYLKVNAGKEKE